jgi:hypothetical protein
MTRNWKPNLPNLAYFAAGLVFFLIVFLLLYVYRVNHQPSADEIKNDNLQAYIDWQQSTMGFDCKDLRESIRQLLENEVSHVLSKRAVGEGWSQHVSAGLQDEMDKSLKRYLACGRLYGAAQRAGSAMLSDLAFSVELDKEMVLLNTLIRFGEPSVGCDKACVDIEFAELKSTYDAVLSRVALPKSVQR